MNVNSIHIWMNIPSFHQNDLFNELTKYCDKLEVIYAHKYDENRKLQGWNFEISQNYPSKIIRKDLGVLELAGYLFNNRTSVHIVNGIWAEPSFFFVIILLNIFGANFLIYSEASLPTKSRTFIKKMLLEFLIRPFSKLLIIRAKGFLAVSVLGVNYFQSLGVHPRKIYRFGYFRNIKATIHKNINAQIIELIFVGQLIESKGIITLLEAIKIIAKNDKLFHLTIVGTGKLAPFLANFIEKNQLNKLVTLQGVVSSNKVMNYIQKADLLIFPSICDGWGMVVNEALQSHIPVLISDQCGAKELIKHEYNGLIFKGKDLNSLTENLLKFLGLSIEKREIMKNNAGEMGEKIAIPIVSNYLRLCIQHALNPINPKPIAPWLND